MLTLKDSTDTLTLHRLIDIAQSEESRGIGASSAARATHALSVSDSCFYCNKPGHIKADCPLLTSRTASAADIKAGMCSLPGHKSHKASQCKQHAQPAPAHAATAHRTVVTLGSDLL
jgi:hypothetical protein